MTKSLPRPDVLVRQVLETQTETTVPPVLRGCVVGPCKQVVEPQILTATGAPTLNAQARVSLPALLQSKETVAGPPWIFSIPNRAALVFSVNEGPKVVVFWENSGNRTVPQIVKAINDSLEEAGETGAVTERVSSENRAFRIRTLERSNQASLRLDPEGVRPAQAVGTVDLNTLTLPDDVENKTFGIAVNEGNPQSITITAGATTPANLAAEISAISGITAEVSSNGRLVINSTVLGEGQTFQITGGSLLVTVGVSAGIYSGRGSTPSLLGSFGFAGRQYSQGAALYSGWELEITRPSMPDPRKNLEELVFEPDTFRTFLNGSGTSLKEIFRTSSPGFLHLNNAVTVVDDGDGDNLSPILSFTSADFTAPATTARVEAGAAPSFGDLEGNTLILGDGGAPRVITFGPCANIQDVIEDIHEVFDPTNGIAASSSGGRLVLECTRKRPDLPNDVRKGLDSTVVIYGGTVFPAGNNYIDPNEDMAPGRWVGDPYPPRTGDEVYLDGILVGKITKVAPGGVADRLRLSAEKPLNYTANNLYIVAKGLEAGDVNRPYPSLLVDGEGRIQIKHGMLRAAYGSVSESISNNTLLPSKADIYQSYTALRLDVSSRSPGLLQLQNTQMVEDLLSPVDERNPLALAAHIALRNSPDYQITALGIDQTSPDYPEGTPQAYARAASHLEAFDVYGIALLSPSPEVAEIFQTHVGAMSAPEGKLERLALYCPKEPTRALDTLVTSGSSGNTVGSGPFTQFDTGVADLSNLLQAEGLEGFTFGPEKGLYLDLETDGLSYNISEVAGSVVTLRTTFVGDANADGFYATSPIPDTLVDVAFGVRIRGRELVLPDGAPDLDAIAEAMAQTAERYSDRRLWVIGPDEAQFNIAGQLLRLPGHYACAAIAGMLTQYPVSQSFTNLPMAAISRVTKTTGRFNERQLSRMAGGGVYLLIQDSADRPVIARQAITSDSTSIESRMDIILKEVDLLSKLIRRSLRKNLGIVNVTQEVMDDVGMVIDSVINLMTGAPKPLIKGATILEIGLSPNGPDKIAVALKAYPHYALNGIDVTIYTLGEPSCPLPDGVQIRTTYRKGLTTGGSSTPSTACWRWGPTASRRSGPLRPWRDLWRGTARAPSGTWYTRWAWCSSSLSDRTSSSPGSSRSGRTGATSFRAGTWGRSRWVVSSCTAPPSSGCWRPPSRTRWSPRPSSL